MYDFDFTISILRFRVITLHLNLYSQICIRYLYQLFYLTRSEEEVEMVTVANGVGKSTGDEMEDVHAKEMTAAAVIKARIEAKVSQL